MAIHPEPATGPMLGFTNGRSKRPVRVGTVDKCSEAREDMFSTVN
jgi:hypothetical protein